MKLAKKSLLISSIFGVNAIIQLVNQIVITRTFGASEGLEVFLAAVALPTVIISAIYATLNDAFLPIYGSLIRESKERAKKFLETSIGMELVLGLGIAVTIVLLNKEISFWMYGQRGNEFVSKVAEEINWLALGIPLAMLAVIGGSVTYAKKQFEKFPLVQLLGNSLILLIVLLLAKVWGAWVLVLAFLVSLASQMIAIFPKEVEKLRINWQEQKNLVLAWLPLIVSFFLFRSENLIIKYFAGLMPQGYFVYLNLASKLFLMATGIATIGIQVLLLPHLVEMINDKTRLVEAKELVNKAKLMGIGLALLTVVSIVGIGPWVLKILFVGGKFSTQDVDNVISLLKWFVLPGIGWAIYPIFLQPIIALKQQRKIAGIAITASSLSLIVGKLVFGNVGVIATMSIMLTTLMFTSIILSEIIWQKEKAKLLA